MRDHLLEAPVIHCDETRLQVLKSDKAPTADHWMWVRAAGPPGRRIVLFDYDPSRGGAVPMRLFQGYGGILLTHAGCMAQVRRYFEDARKAHFAGNATQGQWPKLLVFLAHGEVPLDNNRCENAIRPFVLRRKGWLFTDTVKGAVASANLYSLVETAKANGVEPHAYLSRFFEKLPYANSVEDFEALLPWNTSGTSDNKLS